MTWRKGNRLRVVREENAEPLTRHIYDEIKATLGFPSLQLYYPALGAYPRFLALHWEIAHSVAASAELEQAAERLCADAYTRVYNYFRIPDLRAAGTSPLSHDCSPSLSLLSEYFHHRDALLLLLFGFQMQAMEAPTGVAGVSATEIQRSPTLDEPPPSIDEQTAPAPMRKMFEEIRRSLGTPFVSPEYCAFATRPEFLCVVWQALKRMLASPLYGECKHGVRSTAWSLAAQLPGPAEMSLDRLADAGMPAEEIASLARILELFVDSLSGQMLNLAAAKIALEGGNLGMANGHVARRQHRKEPAA